MSNQPDPIATRTLVEAARRALPLLVRLGDYIGNGAVTGPNSLGERADVLLALREALHAFDEPSDAVADAVTSLPQHHRYDDCTDSKPGDTHDTGDGDSPRITCPRCRIDLGLD